MFKRRALIYRVAFVLLLANIFMSAKAIDSLKVWYKYEADDLKVYAKNTTSTDYTFKIHFKQTPYGFTNKLKEYEVKANTIKQILESYPSNNVSKQIKSRIRYRYWYWPSKEKFDSGTYKLSYEYFPGLDSLKQAFDNKGISKKGLIDYIFYLDELNDYELLRKAEKYLHEVYPEVDHDMIRLRDSIAFYSLNTDLEYLDTYIQDYLEQSSDPELILGSYIHCKLMPYHIEGGDYRLSNLQKELENLDHPSIDSIFIGALIHETLSKNYLKPILYTYLSTYTYNKYYHDNLVKKMTDGLRIYKDKTLAESMITFIKQSPLATMPAENALDFLSLLPYAYYRLEDEAHVKSTLLSAERFAQANGLPYTPETFYQLVGSGLF